MTTEFRKISSAPPLVAFLVAGTFFMENLDGTVIATALPRMADSFGVSAVSLNAGITAYLLTLAVFIPVSGWVADRFGARTVFTSAIALFTISSVLCGLCASLESFITLRIVQGIGGAMMVPVGRLAVLRTTPKEGLVKAIAAITWPGLVAPLLGPPVGGFLVTFASWRWIFYLNLPLGLLAMGLAWLWVENSRPETHRPFDWTGFLTSGLGILGLMVAVELAALDVVPWGRAGVSAAIGIVMSWLAIWHLRRSATPMLDLAPIRFRTFAVTVAGGSCFRVAIGAVPFLLPLMLQVGFGYDAFHSGLLTLTAAAGTLVMKPLTTPLLRRLGFRTVLIIASLATASSLLACAGLTQATPTALMIVVLFAGGFALRRRAEARDERRQYDVQHRFAA